MNLEQKHIDRFWERVDIKNPNQCWEWTALKDNKGYGLLRVKDKNIYAHRISAYLANMPIENKFVCHHCDNPSCVNPNHLFVGTLQDNVKDMIIKNRQAYNESHGMTNLTLEDVLFIKNSYIPGYKNKFKGNCLELAKKYNVTDQTIRNIVKGKTWKYTQ